MKASDSIEYLKISEVAKLLNCPRQTAYKLIDLKDFPAVDISIQGTRPCWRVEKKQLFAWLESREKNGGQPAPVQTKPSRRPSAAKPKKQHV